MEGEGAQLSQSFRFDAMGAAREHRWANPAKHLCPLGCDKRPNGAVRGRHGGGWVLYIRGKVLSSMQVWSTKEAASGFAFHGYRGGEEGSKKGARREDELCGKRGYYMR